LGEAIATAVALVVPEEVAAAKMGAEFTFMTR
jgi:hypothetical protein